MRTEWIPYLLVMAITTYLVRMLPLALFRKQIRSRFAKSFFYYVPYAVLAAMTFPAMLFSTDHFLSALLGLITACVLAYFKRSLIVVAASTCATVLLIEFAIKIL